MSRLDEITALLRDGGVPPDDDDIADRLGINCHYVNGICRQLATEGLTTRSEGPDGKLRNLWRGGATTSAKAPASVIRAPASRPRKTRSNRARSNVENLVEGFSGFVNRFERSKAFTGPSLYFHERAIDLRREHSNLRDLMKDTPVLLVRLRCPALMGHAPHG